MAGNGTVPFRKSSCYAWRRGLAALLCVGAVCCGRACAAAESKGGPHSPAYINVELLLDISPSMDVGATPGDIAAMMHLTPCSVPGAVYRPVRSRRFLRGMPDSGQGYFAYACGSPNGGSGKPPDFNGLKCPIPAARGVAGAPFMMPGPIAPRCADLVPPHSDVAYLGRATAGAPCAFACHWDREKRIGAAYDYYGLARSTIGQKPCYQKGAKLGGCAITLRLDVVKNAVTGLIRTMQERDLEGAAHLSVGVFAFDNNLHPVYPLPPTCGAAGALACQAGRDWPLALGSVGTAPDLPDMPEAGIQPSVSNNAAATDISRAISVLARTYLSAAGKGETVESPAKALIIITDGVEDSFSPGRRHIGALDPSVCDIYKSMGLDVYVLYTPYFSLMNPFYMLTVEHLAESDGPGSLADSLRRCASDPSRNFIAAAPGDAASVSQGLQVFLGRVVAKH